MTTPGKQSCEGVIFEMDHPRGGRRLLDYIFDLADAPGIAWVLSGWHDEYGGRGCAAGKAIGEPEQIDGGGWRVGEVTLHPTTAPYPPSSNRANARDYISGDILTKTLG